MPLGDIYNLGTIDVTNGSLVISGNGVLWTDIIEGDDIYCNGLVGTVDAVGMYFDEITLKAAWQGSTDTAADYYIIKKSWNRYDPALTQAKLREYLETRDAVLIDFTPAGSIAATDVQAAIEEVDSDVTALAADVAATPVSFSAHKNGTDQTAIPASTHTKITFTTEEWDTGSYYDAVNSRWTPPAGLVQLTANVRISTGIVDGSPCVVMIYKNGSVLKEGAMQNPGGTSNFAPVVSIIDVADGNDYYEVMVWLSGTGDKSVSGSTAFTYFQGHVIS